MKSLLRPIPSASLFNPTWAPLRRNLRHPKPSPPPPARFTASRRTRATSAWTSVETHHVVGEHVSPTKGPLYYEECIEKGCWFVISSFGEYYVSGAGGGKVILMMVEAIDIYLIGTVMLVFGMGLYELFISNLDIAKSSSYGSNLLGLFKLSERPKWLEIQSVNELKTKLGHVIVMVLLVGLFEKSKKVTISSSIDLLCFAASILLLSVCLYLLSKLHSSTHGKHA